MIDILNAECFSHNFCFKLRKINSSFEAFEELSVPTEETNNEHHKLEKSNWVEIEANDRLKL